MLAASPFLAVVAGGSLRPVSTKGVGYGSGLGGPRSFVGTGRWERPAPSVKRVGVFRAVLARSSAFGLLQGGGPRGRVGGTSTAVRRWWGPRSPRPFGGRLPAVCPTAPVRAAGTVRGGTASSSPLQLPAHQLCWGALAVADTFHTLYRGCIAYLLYIACSWFVCFFAAFFMYDIRSATAIGAGKRVSRTS